MENTKITYDTNRLEQRTAVLQRDYESFVDVTGTVFNIATHLDALPEEEQRQELTAVRRSFQEYTATLSRAIDSCQQQLRKIDGFLTYFGENEFEKNDEKKKLIFAQVQTRIEGLERDHSEMISLANLAGDSGEKIVELYEKETLEEEDYQPQQTLLDNYIKDISNIATRAKSKLDFLETVSRHVLQSEQSAPTPDFAESLDKGNDFLDRLSESVQNLMNENDGLRKERTGLQQNAEELQEECSRHQKAFQDVEERNDLLKDENDGLTERCGELTEGLESAAQRQEELESEGEEQRQKYAKLENEVEELTSHNELLAELATKFQKRIKEIIRNRDEKYALLARKIAEAEQKSTCLEALLDSYEV